MANLLIIDDNEALCDLLVAKMTKMGHEADHFQTLTDGMTAVRGKSYDVVFLDVGLPDGNGLKAIPMLRETRSKPEVIIITGYAEVSGARLAIENGAWDYVEKGASLDDMILPLTRALQYRNERLMSPRTVSLKREGIIGDSPPVLACLDQVAQASVSDLPLLISGETGSGKELFAWATHENSSRSVNRFVVVDCAALPDSLVESLLFGYEAGAFTGASKQTDGLIREADGGTLFLDEVGELPLSIQKSFLRVLQEHTFRRVGGPREIKSDFRLVAATNRNLERLAREGLFRQDLLYRLHALRIELPPLRERGGDVELLINHHLNQHSHHFNDKRKGFTREFLECLMAYDWPGNIRELYNVIDQAVLASGGRTTLYHTDLPTHIRLQATVGSFSGNVRPVAPPILDDDDEDMTDLKTAREHIIIEFERHYVLRLMRKTKWDIPAACAIAGLSRPRLYELLRKYNITRTKS
jgi:two-component system, NtrC family, response regulator